MSRLKSIFRTDARPLSAPKTGRVSTTGPNSAKQAHRRAKRRILNAGDDIPRSITITAADFNRRKAIKAYEHTIHLNARSSPHPLGLCSTPGTLKRSLHPGRPVSWTHLPTRLWIGFGSLIFIGAGLVFVLVAVDGFLDHLRPRFWPQVGCTILRAGITPNELPAGGFRAQVEFRAQLRESVVTGTTHTDSDDYSELVRVLRKFPMGGIVQGHVNPADGKPRVELDPSRHAHWGMLLFAFIPVVFVCIGAKGLWAAIRGKAPVPADTDASGSPWFTIPFGGAFLVVGCLAVYSVGIQPVIQKHRASAWTEVPCVIEVSRVLSRQGSKGKRTYQPEILYRYEFNGSTHRSSRISAAGLNSSQKAHERTGTFPLGRQTVCRVNPSDPDEAVLDPTEGGSWFALIGLPFAAVGTYVLSIPLRRLLPKTRRI